jgi:hypothetical protein
VSLITTTWQEPYKRQNPFPDIMRSLNFSEISL